jgi:hypothetical protein
LGAGRADERDGPQHGRHALFGALRRESYHAALERRAGRAAE